MGIDNQINMPPDPEIIFRQFLLDQTPITDLVGTRIATRLPAEPTLPFVVAMNNGSSVLDATSQTAINSSTMRINCFAGRWGGDGTKAEPDYSTASNVAQAIYKELFRQENIYVTTSGGTQAKIYSFNIVEAPTRVEEPDLLIANFSIMADMMYRYSE